MTTEENVFCLKRSDLDSLLGEGGNDVKIADLLAQRQYFLPRSRAENDPSYKQLIPYQLFRRGDGYFVYQRGKKVGEQRLAGRLSLGIGGHINRDDAGKALLSPQTYQEALLRERCEELVGLPPCAPLFIGLINDDSDAVSAVHLGAVHLSILSPEADPTIRGASEDLQPQGFWTAAAIKQAASHFERWSLLALALAEHFFQNIPNK